MNNHKVVVHLKYLRLKSLYKMLEVDSSTSSILCFISFSCMINSDGTAYWQLPSTGEISKLNTLGYQIFVVKKDNLSKHFFSNPTTQILDFEKFN